MTDFVRPERTELLNLEYKKNGIEDRIEILESDNDGIYDVENTLNQIITQNKNLKDKVIKDKDDVYATDLKHFVKAYRNVIRSLVISIAPLLLVAAINPALFSIFLKYLLILEITYITISNTYIVTNHFIIKNKASNKKISKFDNRINDALNEKAICKKQYEENCKELINLKTEKEKIISEIKNLATTSSLNNRIINCNKNVKLEEVVEPKETNKVIKKIKK